MKPRLNRSTLHALEAIAELVQKHLESLRPRSDQAYVLEDGLFYLRSFIDAEKAKRGMIPLPRGVCSQCKRPFEKDAIGCSTCR
jgi:hypothetical protein